MLGQEHANSVAMAEGIPILIDINKEKVDNLAKELNKKYSVDAKDIKSTLPMRKK